MTMPDRAAEAAWTALMRTSRHLLEAVEARLKSAGHPPLAWYDAMLELERAGDEGLRPYELKERLLLPQYGTSRLLDRMAKAGLVERRDCADDGRGYVVAISKKGRKLRRAMWPVYADVLSANISNKLTSDEAATMASLLSKL